MYWTTDWDIIPLQGQSQAPPVCFEEQDGSARAGCPVVRRSQVRSLLYGLFIPSFSRACGPSSVERLRLSLQNRLLLTRVTVASHKPKDTSKIMYHTSHFRSAFVFLFFLFCIFFYFKVSKLISRLCRFRGTEAAEMQSRVAL